MNPAHLILSLFLVLASARAADPAPDGMEFFEKKIRPVLVERCYQCHSVEKGKTKGDFAIDSREALRKGGESGPALIPGDPEKSKIIEAVRWKNQDFQMPPKKALSTAEVADLETWVKMGAPDPRDQATVAPVKARRVIDIKEGRKFWSFQPLSDPALPTVHDAAWVKSPIDAFVLAKLEASGLRPAPPADKRTLLRRAAFDLTGLPPTPDEAADFVSDSSPLAFAKVIERLLASPAYGERWGRHWLDLARYADSNGMDENVAYGHAWRYRDYVVRAFNEDKPFDQFLIEQIAGDLLPYSTSEERVANLTATGFLALGGKVLAEPDVRKMQMDVIDEQMDTMGKAFLGMTFGCCRCHDHKFDPIATTDYYSLAAIFRSTKSIADDTTGAIKYWYEHSLATPEQQAAKKAYEAQVAAQRKKVTDYIAKAKSNLRQELQDHAADYLAAAARLEPDPAFGEVKGIAAEKQLRPRYLLTCRLYLTRHPQHPFFQAWREMAGSRSANEVAARYGPLFAEARTGMKAVLAKDPKATKLNDERLDPALAALNDLAGFLAIPDKDTDAFDASEFAEVDRMNAELMKLESEAPDPPAIMGATDGEITKTLPVHIRGSYLTLGQPCERGFPEVMRTSYAKPILPAHESGRLELARWMASSEHPLTSRVSVNRIWRWHFGKGIVASTDNFGTLGDRPSHPELLDWLARRFIEEGWSTKEMHRLIMLSSTYQQSSAAPTGGRDPKMVDPENRLLWRFNIQRLEAEEIRDSLLAVSGWLDRQVGGKTIPLHDREFVFNHTSTDRTTYETPRRALYLPIIRNHLYDMLEQFDYPDPTMPTGSRNATVVAPQALMMMNAPVVMNSADRLAARLLTQAGSDDAACIEQAYVAAYCRPPEPYERRRMESYLHSLDDAVAGENGDAKAHRQREWSLLCQTLFAANEFIYLR